jgi:hypothetical protein
MGSLGIHKKSSSTAFLRPVTIEKHVTIANQSVDEVKTIERSTEEHPYQNLNITTDSQPKKQKTFSLIAMQSRPIGVKAKAPALIPVSSKPPTHSPIKPYSKSSVGGNENDGPEPKLFTLTTAAQLTKSILKK